MIDAKTAAGMSKRGLTQAITIQLDCIMHEIEHTSFNGLNTISLYQIFNENIQKLRDLGYTVTKEASTHMLGKPHHLIKW